jgi:hypothetical protein
MTPRREPGIAGVTEDGLCGGAAMGGVSRRSARSLRRLVAVVLCATLLLTAGPASAEDDFLGDVGIGLGTALVNVLYIPAKFTYATVGSLIGGFAWLLTLGDTDTAMGVWEPTLGGSYVVTPSMLRGDEPIEFSGTASTTSTSSDTVEEVEEVDVVEEDVEIQE